MTRALVTGSAGHLGEAMMRTLRQQGIEAIGVDIKASAYTNEVISITDAQAMLALSRNVDVIYHTATLHKPHVATHTRQAFVDTNVSGTLALLEAALANDVPRFVFTSTTSVFGDAMRPPIGEPAVWITESVVPQPRNIYGSTKLAAEGLCELFHRKMGLNCVILRTSRFFPEEDDNRSVRDKHTDANIKTNEFLYRRVEVEDVVNAHLLAAARAESIGFDRFIISATSPFQEQDLADLNRNAPGVVRQYFPDLDDCFEMLGWQMFAAIDRVYVNARARHTLDWQPLYDFNKVLHLNLSGENPGSELSRQIGSKGYHEQIWDDGPFPIDEFYTDCR